MWWFEWELPFYYLVPSLRVRVCAYVGRGLALEIYFEISKTHAILSELFLPPARGSRGKFSGAAFLPHLSATPVFPTCDGHVLPLWNRKSPKNFFLLTVALVIIYYHSSRKVTNIIPKINFGPPTDRHIHTCIEYVSM